MESLPSSLVVSSFQNPAKTHRHHFANPKPISLTPQHPHFSTMDQTSVIVTIQNYIMGYKTTSKPHRFSKTHLHSFPTSISLQTNHLGTSKGASKLQLSTKFPSKFLLLAHAHFRFSASNLLNCLHTSINLQNNHLGTCKSTSKVDLFAQNPIKFQLLAHAHLTFPIFTLVNSLPCFASETIVTQDVSDKINLESVLVAVDDFFTRNPFFVAGCTFIWLVVVPVVEYYMSKYKYVSAIDVFRKLRDDPNAQLLDIRDKKSLKTLGSPNLTYMNKSVAQAEFLEGNEDGFVRNVLESFRDPANTTICILDSNDGNSLKVAELLVKNGGFKEAYAIKGGVIGKKGWLAIQKTLLPPAVHMIPRKRDQAADKFGTNGVAGRSINKSNENLAPSIPRKGAGQNEENDQLREPANSSSPKKTVYKSFSPYPNYPDLKPPSSPTPSKPTS